VAYSGHFPPEPHSCLQYNYILFNNHSSSARDYWGTPAREVDLHFGVDLVRVRYVNYTLRWVAYKLRYNWNGGMQRLLGAFEGGVSAATLSPGVGRDWCWYTRDFWIPLGLTSMRSLSTNLRRAISECLSTASHSPMPNIIVPSTCRRRYKKIHKHLCVQVALISVFTVKHKA